MKNYEGLFILDLQGREEGLKECVDKISHEIQEVGGSVETVQKMENRPFTRVTNKKITSGFYVNIIFKCESGDITALQQRFQSLDEVYRISISEYRAPRTAPATATTPAA